MRLCTLRCDGAQEDAAASVKWNPDGRHLAIGTFLSGVHYYDAKRGMPLRTYETAGQRVACIDFNSDYTFASGSFDGTVRLHDLRMKEDTYAVLKGHSKEVCGLKWSPDGKTLASGSDDNKVILWRADRDSNPVWSFSHHHSAVKALAWNPHQPQMLASGGGNFDPSIRLWDTTSREETSSLYAGSQITNLGFSQSVD